MQQGRVSTIRFNEWICVCAQHEKAIARIGRQVYQGYSRGLIQDHHAIELCKEISQCFADSKRIRAEMEEELERDALRGLSAEEAKAAEDVLEMTSSQKALRRARLQVTKFMGRGTVNRSLQAYRDRVVTLSRDLGLRALAMYQTQPLLKMEGHARLCQLAVKLEEDSNKKWEEITKSKNDKGTMDLSFHTMLIGFIANFASFSRGTAIGKMLLKLMKYDSKEEEKKLTKQYEGSKTADALVAQMAEVEEPDPDIGREMATMERDYIETPTDWGLPSSGVSDTWIPDTSDNWSPEAETPKPVSATPSPAPAQPASSPDGPKPQVLRQRRPVEQMSSEAWASSEPVEEWAPPAAPTARIGQAPPTSEPEVEDWASTPEDEDDFPAAPGPRLGAPPLTGGMPAKPALGGAAPAMPPKPTQIGTHMPPKPAALGGAMPAKPTPAPPKQPAASSTPTPAVPPSPVAPSRPGAPAPVDPPLPPLPWERPAAAQPPLPPLPPLPMRSLDIPAPAPTQPSRPAAPPTPAASASNDPLLRLLRPEPAAEPPKSDDDLLPAFLRERKDEDSLDSSSFIPDLPESVDSGLKIIPFGSQPKKPPEEPDSFIPRMPD